MKSDEIIDDFVEVPGFFNKFMEVSLPLFSIKVGKEDFPS